jgi:branched-chain amino acid transport system ATP-binding protein
MTAAIEARGLTAGIGTITLLRDVDMSLAHGKVLAVVGPNGAGKTTFMRALSGLLPRMAGEVLFDGQPLRSGDPYAANRAGLVFVPGDRALFTTLTVGENIELATKKKAPEIDEVVGLFPALRNRWSVPVGAISGGEQQMVAMARGLVQKPKVLLVDELSMGLAPAVVSSLMPLVRRVADEMGTAVILIEQHVRLALQVADQALVLVRGEVALNGDAKELLADMPTLEAIFLEGLVARTG